MSEPHDRDAATDRLLRQALRPDDPSVTDACLDAERAAAWLDGGLAGAERDRVEAHLADCSRCQAVVAALARTADAPVPAGQQTSGRRWVGWLVPLAAAAAIVVAVVVLPDRGGLETPEQVAQSFGADEAVGRLEGAAARAATSPDREDVTRGNEATTQARSEAAAPPPAAAEAPALQRQAAPAAALEERLADVAAFEIVSPDPSMRWRLRGRVVERTTNGGVTWTAAGDELAVVPIAGSAPSATTCWLVGPGGAVFLTTDGSTWRRLAAPAPVDLTGVEAADARNATVTAADGRRFRTADGGATWSESSLQGI